MATITLTFKTYAYVGVKMKGLSMRKARHCRELCKSDWENSYCFELMDYNIDGNTAKVKFEYLAERLREINLDLPIDKVRIVGHYPDDPEGSKLLASLKD